MFINPENNLCSSSRVASRIKQALFFCDFVKYDIRILCKRSCIWWLWILRRNWMTSSVFPAWSGSSEDKDVFHHIMVFHLNKTSAVLVETILWIHLQLNKKNKKYISCMICADPWNVKMLTNVTLAMQFPVVYAKHPRLTFYTTSSHA